MDKDKKESKMICKKLSAALVGIVIAISFNANAGLIEVDIFGNGTNKGFSIDGSGLEWMDFGINITQNISNIHNFSYVSGQLGVGGLYEGWRLPTTGEVSTMWTAAFIEFKGIATFYDANRNGPGQFQTSNAGTLYDTAFNILGVNTSTVYGYFEGTGSLSRVVVVSGGSVDTVYLNDFNNLDYYRTYSFAGKGYNTLLVRTAAQQTSPTTSVPEPSTLAIFALGIMGLAFRRSLLVNKKQ